MRRFRPSRPSPAMAVALLALFVALGGTGIAASRFISAKQVRKGSLPGDRLKRASVAGDRLKRGGVNGDRLKRDSVGGLAIRESRLAKVPAAGLADNAVNASNAQNANTLARFAVLQTVRLTATSGASDALARAAAPARTLFQKGQLSLSAKCFSSGTGVTAEVYLGTSVNGAVLEGYDNLRGGATDASYVLTSTPEATRRVARVSAGPSSAQLSAPDAQDFVAVARDGRQLHGQVALAVKNGGLAAPTVGNGPYGDGDVCLVQGSVAG